MVFAPHLGGAEKNFFRYANLLPYVYLTPLTFQILEISLPRTAAAAVAFAGRRALIWTTQQRRITNCLHDRQMKSWSLLLILPPDCAVSCSDAGADSTEDWYRGAQLRALSVSGLMDNRRGPRRDVVGAS